MAASIGITVGLCALLLQFAIAIPASIEGGRSVTGSIVWFFSFFTILTNIAVLLVYLEQLTGAPAFFGSAAARAGVLVAICAVALVYALVLASLWEPAGLLLVADTLLHYVCPAVFVAWWIFLGRDGTLAVSDSPLWLLYPLIYLCWAMLQGAFTGEYPYPFLDLGVKSLSQVAVASVTMLGLFVLICIAVLAADRFLPLARKPSTPS